MPAARSEQSAEAITRAAVELCLEVGYAKLSVEGIAARAGVGKQTIYRWWPSKGAVLLDALLSKMTLDAPFPDTGDIVVDLRTQMTGAIRTLMGPEVGPHYRALIGDAQHNPALAADLRDRLIGPLCVKAANRIRVAQQQGQIRAECDPDAVVSLLYGAFYHRMLLLGTTADAAFVDDVLSMGFVGLRP
jgi:AcrR family transcriptional regulator